MNLKERLDKIQEEILDSKQSIQMEIENILEKYSNKTKLEVKGILIESCYEIGKNDVVKYDVTVNIKGE